MLSCAMARKLTKPPCLVAGDGHGQVFEIPELQAAGRRLRALLQPEPGDYLPMPNGSSLFELPGRKPVGFDPVKKKWVTVEAYRGMPVNAVAAFLAPAYTQMLHAAFVTEPGAVRLPLFAYAAVGWRRNQFYVPAVRVDADVRQDPEQFDQRSIHRRANALLKKHPRNRLVAHLVENCVKRYHCPAAQNWAMGRWEAPIPTSPSCNARCLGCISRQPNGEVSSTQDRLEFMPSVEEILAYAVPHLEKADHAVVSFGQGCEGEPLLQGELLIEAVREIRKRTKRGVINLNTNASRPQVVEKLCEAGLDSIRVSLNSAQPEMYQKYFSPRGYGFNEVMESIRTVAGFNRWISLNYFIFPGFTDHPEETAHLQKLVRRYNIPFIQMRNLNIDPEWYIETLALPDGGKKAIGIKAWMEQLKQRNPFIHFGYFNPHREAMASMGRVG